ncbi:MAG: hypothetical protein ABIQ95_15575 [Bdellovibrionia bacterium]
MTAEISVMNKLAVAMAADSAVTVVGKKVYNTSSKLFPVTHDLPIGIMFYGNAHLMNVPWETVVADFRKSLKGKRFDHVKECGEEFLRFLPTAKTLFSEESQKKIVFGFIRVVFQDHINKIDGNIKSAIEAKGQVTDIEVGQLVEQHFASEIAKWDQAAFVEGMDAAITKSASKKYEKELEQIFVDTFQKLPVSTIFLESLVRLATNYIYKALIFDVFRSGVVFCGFGESEKYPSLFSTELDFVFDGVVKHTQPNLHSITDGSPASVHPFAQQDVVASFLKGIDPNFFSLIDGYMKTFFEQLSTTLAGALPTDEGKKEELQALLENLKDSAPKAVMQKLEEVSQVSFVAPVMSAAQVLSKDDLAHMAEALVSLTSFRRKISLDLDTVGGPIDVAVISKKDGFIWIKRKHYFDPKLNPHYFGREQ